MIEYRVKKYDWHEHKEKLVEMVFVPYLRNK